MQGFEGAAAKEQGFGGRSPKVQRVRRSQPSEMRGVCEEVTPQGNRDKKTGGVNRGKECTN